VSDLLDRRRLGRATLARQHLLAREPASAIGMIEHLGGMQSQGPLAPYVGLWTRMRDFDPAELSDLTRSRAVVRLHLMRNTVHLASARDALGWHPLFSAVRAAGYRGHFPGGLDGVDRDALLALARELLAEEPRTRAELGRLLAQRWPRADPAALSYAVTHHLPVCQVPPRGLWGRGGAAAWVPLDSWLGSSSSAAPVDDLVLRYLGAFGPASVADVQVWSGLSRLGEVLERLPLRTFRDEDGQTLYDLPDAPRPEADTPAPPRFLPAYDNVLLSHQDRRRLIPHERPVPLPPGNGADIGTILLDGLWQGIWRARDGVLRVETFRPPSPDERSALLDEGARLGSFLGADSEYDVELVVT
jgi:hypothetical protein